MYPHSTWPEAATTLPPSNLLYEFGDERREEHKKQSGPGSELDDADDEEAGRVLRVAVAADTAYVSILSVSLSVALARQTRDPSRTSAILMESNAPHFKADGDEMDMDSESLQSAQPFDHPTPPIDAVTSNTMRSARSLPAFHPPFTVGYVYSADMGQHFSPRDHPECPDRLEHIWATIKGAHLLNQMKCLPIRPVKQAEAMLVHTEDHWNKVESIQYLTQEQIANSEEYYDQLSLYAMAGTTRAARLSCGGVIEASLAVARGEVRKCFAIVRPPGHHAEPDEHMGFCFYNNVAVAARVVQQLTKIKKILILDWDVHHAAGMTDADYILAFQRIIMPIATEFAPELVMISAGFDAAAGDELGECFLSPAGYAHMTYMLSGLARGRVVVALESALAVTRVILGEPPEELPPMVAGDSASETIMLVAKQQSKYWRSVDPKSYFQPLAIPVTEVLKNHRQYFLLNQYQFLQVPFPVQMEERFTQQVLVSPDFMSNKTVVFFVHELSTTQDNSSIGHNKRGMAW
ncbi:hypothetical protein ONZ45_g14469 [Pleurotus djamor]|nr:hypothetical protein ONZ45_g14469 [Pleurotus djamor]